jgi:hypothetical protein
LWDAFGNHLREVSQQKDMARDYLNLWDSYLPYAIFFGLETPWINHFVEMQASVPRWFHVSAGSYGQAIDSNKVPLTLDGVSKVFTVCFVSSPTPLPVLPKVVGVRHCGGHFGNRYG